MQQVANGYLYVAVRKTLPSEFHDHLLLLAWWTCVDGPCYRNERILKPMTVAATHEAQSHSS